jgi:RND family efflux transporter MFP subunit
MTLRRGPLVLALAAIVITALAVGWFLLSGGAPRVETAKVTRGPAVELVYATGFVEAQQPVTVSSRVTAPVTQVLVEEGQRVVSGQPLVSLDDAEQRGLLAQSQAELRRATLAANRIGTLYRQGWATRTANDEAVAARDAARASAAALRARLDQYAIRSGISGVVLKRDVYPGDLATPGKQLMQLGDPTLMRITATVDERDITRVQVGQEALMSSEGLARVVRGRVAEVTPGGDPGQRAFRVRIKPEGDTALPLGLTLEVNLVTSRHERALLVPESAVSEGRAWVVTDGRARGRNLRTGIAGGGKVEVLSGLSEGDTVIVDAPADLKDGDRVRP